MKFIAVTIALMLAVYLGYKWFYPTYSWHQKMTVEVEVDGKVFAGSSVIAISVTRQPRLLPEIKTIFETRGEAVVVELPDRRYLFALLKGIGPKHTSEVFRDRINVRARKKLWARELSRLREKRDIPPELYPLLVTFSDIDEPSSVQKVDPDDLAKHFGKGVSLKRIALELTSEPVTKNIIEKVLRWLSGYTGRLRPFEFGKLESELTPEETIYKFHFMEN